MVTYYISFSATLITILVMLKFREFHIQYSADSDFNGPQKFHRFAVPRIGGIAIFAGIFLGLVYEKNINNLNHIETIIGTSGFLILIAGLSEDITKRISARSRLVMIAIVSTFAVIATPLEINSLGITKLDPLISNPLIYIPFTIFAITGLVNAYNIIDGFNGLASMVGLITLLSLAYVSYTHDDQVLLSICLISIASIFGFFIVNYPNGLIFLGDGGAYLLGFLIATLSILLVSRHNEISPLFGLAVNSYPVIETIFTIYRRKFNQNKALSEPDDLHFHTILFRSISKKLKHRANYKIAPFLWLFTLLIVTSAVYFRNSGLELFAVITISTTIYLFTYHKITTKGIAG